jgi:hypothetical protein
MMSGLPRYAENFFELPENPFNVASGNDAPTNTSPGVLANALLLRLINPQKIKKLNFKI